MSAKFGPAGNSEAFSKVYKSSLNAPAWIAAQGLEHYEYQCGKGVHIGEDTARKLGQKALEAGVTLSIHAPYFINLANPEAESLQKTIKTTNMATPSSCKKTTADSLFQELPPFW